LEAALGVLEWSSRREAECAVNHKLLQCKILEEDSAVVDGEIVMNKNKATSTSRVATVSKKLTVPKHCKHYSSCAICHYQIKYNTN
jgi:hypothetical protein